MKIKQKIIVLALVLVSMVAVGMPQTASAADCKPDAKKGTSCCGGAKTSILSCDQNKSGAKSAKETGVWGLLLIALKIMTAGVGILAVGGIVYASILYASASDSAEQTKKAKDIIRNVVIGLVAYGVMYIALNFLIPGGIFS